MKPSELFGVIIRATGFLVILYGLWNLWAGCEIVMENILRLNDTGESDLPSIFNYFAFGIPTLMFGLGCFFLADWVVKLAYRGAAR